MKVLLQVLFEVVQFIIENFCNAGGEIKNLLLFVQDVFWNLPTIIVWAPTEALYQIIDFLPSTHPENTISARLAIIAGEHPIFAAAVGSASPYLAGALGSAMTIIAVKRYFLKM